jgi:large subunit ribosomal protein L22
MEFKARQRWVRLSAQKARLVADVVRGLDVQDAIDTLKFMPQKAAPVISKAVRSALANAREHKGEEKPDVDKLFVKTLMVDEGPTLKRIKPRAYGRAHRIRRRTSHVFVVLAERTEAELAAARVRGGRGGKAAKAEAGKPAAERGAPAKPKKARFLGFKKKEDKYGAKVKGAGETPEESAPESAKSERGSKRGRKKK